MDDIRAIRRYQVGDRIYVQAQRIWLLLAAFVSGPTRKPDDPITLTYGDVAEAMGYDRRAGQTLWRQLGIVGNYCVHNKLPALNSIVVNRISGDPGDEVVLSPGNENPKDEWKAVFKTNWLEFGVPTTGTLRKVWESMPVSARGGA